MLLASSHCPIKHRADWTRALHRASRTQSCVTQKSSRGSTKHLVLECSFALTQGCLLEVAHQGSPSLSVCEQQALKKERKNSHASSRQNTVLCNTQYYSVFGSWVKDRCLLAAKLRDWRFRKKTAISEFGNTRNNCKCSMDQQMPVPTSSDLLEEGMGKVRLGKGNSARRVGSV